MKKIFNLILGIVFFILAVYFLIWKQEWVSSIIGGLLGAIFIYKWKNIEVEIVRTETPHN